MPVVRADNLRGASGVCGGVLARSLLALFESEGLATLERAVGMVCPGCEVFGAIADAWERYPHVKDIPSD